MFWIETRIGSAFIMVQSLRKHIMTSGAVEQKEPRYQFCHTRAGKPAGIRQLLPASDRVYRYVSKAVSLESRAPASQLGFMCSIDAHLGIKDDSNY